MSLSMATRAAVRGPARGDLRLQARARVVGWFDITTGDDVSAYGAEVDSRFNRFDATMSGWLAQKYGPTAISAPTPAWDSTQTKPIGGFTAEAAGMLAEDVDLVRAWKGDFTSWAIFWGNTRNSVQTPGFESSSSVNTIERHDSIVRAWQTRLRAKGAAVSVDPAAPKPDGSDASSNGSGGGSDPLGLKKITGSIGTIVWIVGIGVVVYFGLVYIAPALLGAAAKTKSAGRELRTA